jgi:NAD(P)-dependent dehydrogenase (short-subunit alcohol dehydrogenase family)
MLGYTLAQEVAPEIRVNMVAPGLIRTPMNDAYETPYDIHANQIPMARAGETEDIARTVLFLASDESAYITRSVITVDGGMQAGDVNNLWSGAE